METLVTYCTEALLHKSNGLVGTQVQATFQSIDAAKAAPLPSGYTFALISTVEGRHIYTSNSGWSFSPIED